MTEVEHVEVGARGMKKPGAGVRGGVRKGTYMLRSSRFLTKKGFSHRQPQCHPAHGNFTHGLPVGPTFSKGAAPRWEALRATRAPRARAWTIATDAQSRKRGFEATILAHPHLRSIRENERQAWPRLRLQPHRTPGSGRRHGDARARGERRGASCSHLATHGARAPPSAAPQHTPQVAQHAAALAGLACAEHALANGWNVRTTLGSETTHRSIERQPGVGTTPIRGHKHDSMNCLLRKKVARPRADYTQTLELLAPSRATPLSLLAAAEKAAFLPSLRAKVATHVTPPHSALWDGSRIWDPGD